MRIFGFGARRGDVGADEGDAAGSTAGTGAPDASRTVSDGRGDLLEQISSFLLANTLAVTPRNLVISHAIFSGSNLSLARKIFRQQMAGLPIDQQWLDEAFNDSGDVHDKKAELDKFVSRFEKSLASFSDTAREASEVTSDYTSALEKTARELETRSFNANDISALAGLNRSMLERTKLLEETMRASRREAEKLKQNLEVARHDADIDHLTGLSNRRAFEAVYEREYREARAAIDHLCVAICDIDHFKRINDTHGHDTGDRVIQAVAELLRDVAGDTCHAARHGGEEFVLLFRGVTTEQARERLDRAREAFAARHLINQDTNEPIGHVSFSGGVADVFAYEDPRAALRAADDALYQAKEAGRNQIALATS